VQIIDLVGGLEHVLSFHSVGNFIIPSDELHHFSEGYGNHQPVDGLDVLNGADNSQNSV
jgi:hypothetical protein